MNGIRAPRMMVVMNTINITELCRMLIYIYSLCLPVIVKINAKATEPLITPANEIISS
jgi:hypothetical protein